MDQMKKQKIEEIERKAKLERLKAETDNKAKPVISTTEKEKAALKTDLLEIAKRKKIEEIERKQLLEQEMRKKEIAKKEGSIQKEIEAQQRIQQIKDKEMAIKMSAIEKQTVEKGASKTSKIDIDSEVIR